MPLTALVFWITYAVGICAAVFNPVTGLALYVLVYHINPETQWWGGAARAIGLRTSFTVALAAALGVLIRQPRLEHGARQFQVQYVLALLLGIVALCSLAWGIELSDRGEYQAEKYVKLMVILYLLVRCVRTPAHYHLILLAWLAGVAYMGYQAWGGVGRSIGGRLTAGVGGPDFEDSSALAVHLVATLPLIGACFFMARTWLGRIFALVTGALATNMLVMTRTRNALAGLAAVTFSTIFSLPRGYRMKGLAAVVVGTLAAIQLTDPAWWTRMKTVSEYQHDSSATWRIRFWQAAVEMANDYPLGIGLGNFHQTVMKYIPDLKTLRSAHNTLVTCLAELGWFGLVLFLGVFGFTILRLGHVRRASLALPAKIEVQVFRWRAGFHLGWHTIALRAALLGYLAGAMFTTRLFAEDLWLLIGFAMCLYNVSKHMAAESALDDSHVRTAPGWHSAPPERLALPLPVVNKVDHAASWR